MSIGLRILTGLMAMIALSGVAAAQNAPCPECDTDGPGNDQSTYSSVDLGVVTNDAEALADTDWAVPHSDEGKGFWAWLSLCFGAFLGHVGDVFGVDADVDGNVDLYAGQDGVDLDATLQMDEAVCGQLDGNVTAAAGDDGDCVFGYDRSALGDTDGQTWETMGDVHAQLDDAGVEHDLSLPGESVPSVDEDLCLDAEMNLGVCR